MRVGWFGLLVILFKLLIVALVSERNPRRCQNFIARFVWRGAVDERFGIGGRAQRTLLLLHVSKRHSWLWVGSIGSVTVAPKMQMVSFAVQCHCFA